MTVAIDTRRLTRAGLILLVLVASVPVAGLVVARRGPALALINESPSLPRGLYLRRFGADPGRGAIVALAQPAAAAAYLNGLGMPAEILLIKRVAAVGGDRVCRRGDRVETPGRVVLVRTRDRYGTALPAWNGCRRLEGDQLFLLGDTASSFDSRYFGPVRRGDLDGVYRDGLTW